MGALAGAALPVTGQTKPATPQQAPDANLAKRDVPGAQVRAQPAHAGGGLASVRKAVEQMPGKLRDAFSSAPDEFAPGKNGGIARWDNLREQLRKEHRLNEDDPLFALVNALEEMELGLVGYLRQHRESSENLIAALMDAADLLDSVRDTQEQSTNVLSDLRPALEDRLVPLLEKLIARLDEKEQQPAAAEVATPASAPVLVVPRPPEGWWIRLGRVLRAVSE